MLGEYVYIWLAGERGSSNQMVPRELLWQGDSGHYQLFSTGFPPFWEVRRKDFGLGVSRERVDFSKGSGEIQIMLET